MNDKDIIEAVKATMLALGITRHTDVAREAGVNHETLRQWLTGKPKEMRQATRNALLAWLRSKGRLKDGSPFLPIRRVGIYGVAHCMTSKPRFCDWAPESDHDIPWTAVPDTLSQYKKLAAFRAVDSSMIPKVLPNDIVFFSEEARLENGHLCLCKYDDTIVCKYYQFGEDRITLTSEASGYPPIYVLKQEIVWCYRALKVITERDV